MKPPVDDLIVICALFMHSVSDHCYYFDKLYSDVAIYI